MVGNPWCLVASLPATAGAYIGWVVQLASWQGWAVVLIAVSYVSLAIVSAHATAVTLNGGYPYRGWARRFRWRVAKSVTVWHAVVDRTQRPQKSPSMYYWVSRHRESVRLGVGKPDRMPVPQRTSPADAWFLMVPTGFDLRFLDFGGLEVKQFPPVSDEGFRHYMVYLPDRERDQAHTAQVLVSKVRGEAVSLGGVPPQRIDDALPLLFGNEAEFLVTDRANVTPIRASGPALGS